MPEEDNYTRIARKWSPVIDAVSEAKTHLETHCEEWSLNHMTTLSWIPTHADPPKADLRAHQKWVSSPKGTDPATCKDAFIVYVLSKTARGLPRPPLVPPLMPQIQTWELYTCSIGSFGIYVTVDIIDCFLKVALMNIWMYNSMDTDSFGRFANHPVFAACGMKRQVMWWNWHIVHRWGPGAPKETPESETKSGTAEW
jgi:hypothetical protein